MADMMALLLRIREVPGSLLATIFGGFPKSLQENVGIITQITTRSPHFTSFPVDYSLIILLFGGIFLISVIKINCHIMKSDNNITLPPPLFPPSPIK
jgi:hypothetical protein